MALALEEAGADLVACADIEEGHALREAGVGAEILVFGALSVSDLDGLFDCRLTPTISTPGAARAVQAAARKYNQRLRYHLKIDTGMNRLGFRFDNVRRSLPELLASPNLELAAIYTHFATADDPASPLFNEQRLRFERRSEQLPDISRRPSQRRACVTPGGSTRPERTPYSTPPTAPPCCAIRACGTTACARPSALRHRAAAARIDASADADHDAHQPHRRGEGRADGRRRRLRREVQRGGPDDHRDRAGGLRRRPGPAARRPRQRADPRPSRADCRFGLHGHAHGGRDRPRCVAG